MFLTIADTAEYLNISKSQVRNLISNEPSFPKIFSFGNKAFRIDKSDLDKWVKTRKVNLDTQVDLSSVSYGRPKKKVKKVDLKEVLENYDFNEGLLDGTTATI